jgi:predicted AAA+ superfamily ATPase
MHRKALDYLRDWQHRPIRKPLVIRGARQVGKSYLVRAFAEERFDSLLQVDFEADPELATLFAGTPRSTIQLLETRFGTRVVPGQTLLFLDEIQAAPGVFAKLRHFREEMPELHVIAAGSLLDFALARPSFSVPVGRIEYLHLGPMTFEEFLAATGAEKLADYLANFRVYQEIPLAIHGELLRLLRQFLVVGGMPEAIAAFVGSGSVRDCDAAKQSILSTYREDFAKYAGRVDHARLRKVFSRVPFLVGTRFKYAQVDRDERSRELSRALDLLCLARVIHKVRHTASNGVPLAAEADDSNFKALFLDVGLLCRACGLSLVDIADVADAMLVNAGAVAEQFIGQHLLDVREFFEEPELHYWTRETRNSAAEVDYVLSQGGRVVPVEVKAGKSGSLKSLHSFIHHKGHRFAMRFNSDRPSLLEDAPNTISPGSPSFRLLSLPLYLVGQTRRLCREAMLDGGDGQTKPLL